MSRIIVTFDVTRVVRERPVGPGDAEPGADVAECSRRCVNTSSASDSNASDRRVDRDHRCADGPDADVEEDEGQ